MHDKIRKKQQSKKYKQKSCLRAKCWRYNIMYRGSVIQLVNHWMTEVWSSNVRITEGGWGIEHSQLFFSTPPPQLFEILNPWGVEKPPPPSYYLCYYACMLLKTIKEQWYFS